MAKVDVLLPVRNGIDFLAESLDSICNQTFTDWRLLVLDHGSTDGSRELAQSYQQRDARVVVLSFPDAVGLSGLLNKGLDICDCEYVMRHDADDIAMPDRMEVTLTAFRQNPGVVVIGGQATIINGVGQETGVLGMPLGKDRLIMSALFRNPIIHPAAMMDFSAVKDMGIRYGIDFLNVLPTNQQMSVHSLAEDYFLFGQLAILGKCLNIPNILIKYRLHGANVGMQRFLEQMELSLKISRNLARSFYAIHQLTYSDPAPFCNHGGILYEVNGKSDFSREYNQLESTFEKAVGRSAEINRELAYRRVISTRSWLKLLCYYYSFQRKYVPIDGEWYAVKSWFVRHMPGKQKISVPAEQLM